MMAKYLTWFVFKEEIFLGKTYDNNKKHNRYNFFFFFLGSDLLVENFPRNVKCWWNIFPGNFFTNHTVYGQNSNNSVDDDVGIWEESSSFFCKKNFNVSFFQYLGCMDEIFNKLKNKKHNACMACVVHNAMKLNQTNKLTWLGWIDFDL